MLSPFPGMDPYLERPAKWSSVHTRLINAISDQLADTLAPDFYVEIEERIVLTLADNPDVRYQIEPDVYVVHGQEALTSAAEATATGARQIQTPTVVEAVYEGGDPPTLPRNTRHLSARASDDD